MVVLIMLSPDVKRSAILPELCTLNVIFLEIKSTMLNDFIDILNL
ncbi:protein of unknown function [Xenorhabdus doucetiae]|uniref:Uncharacterized protein n=1 Tax=Xenorhabdus doucetiae TaxID=351671 RepID=A0A068QV70_9GAMM|nr:protein of unknown function [Xenorhabdus doucetiae]